MEEKPFGRRRQRQSPSCNPFKPNNLPMAARHTREVSVLAARQRSRFELDQFVIAHCFPFLGCEIRRHSEIEKRTRNTLPTNRLNKRIYIYIGINLLQSRNEKISSRGKRIVEKERERNCNSYTVPRCRAHSPHYFQSGKNRKPNRKMIVSYDDVTDNRSPIAPILMNFRSRNPPPRVQED